MKHHQAGIGRKRERLFLETKTTMSYGLMLLAVCIFIPLVVLWPQKFNAIVFNSRLSYHLVLDAEDYFTCSTDYKKFVIHEPDTSTAMYTIFVFNVTNAKDVLDSGYKPDVHETGPFGYRKLTYKYDISFDPVQSETVTFKEYNLLEEVTDVSLCQSMYFRMDRGYLSEFDPCPGTTCHCLSHNMSVTIINPLFLKTIYEESSQDILAYYSLDIFQQVQSLIENDFVEATRSHLVPYALQEIYQFREQMQLVKLVNASFSFVLKDHSLRNVSEMIQEHVGAPPIPATCGLATFGVTRCPISIKSSIQAVQSSLHSSHFSNMSHYLLPSVEPLLNSSSPYSLLNFDIGLPMWLTLCWHLGYLDFNLGNGYTMVTTAQEEAAYWQVTQYLHDTWFGNVTVNNNVKTNEMVGSEVIVHAMAYYLARIWMIPMTTICNNLVYQEFVETSDPVMCAPTGDMCVWQWGHMVKYKHANQRLSNNMIFSFIDMNSKVNTNPNNFYFDGNSGQFFNTHLLCTRNQNVMKPVEDSCSVTDLVDMNNDALINQPAGLWGIDHQMNAVNHTDLYYNFKKQDLDTASYYFLFACNVSSLLHDVYRHQPFHDKYVISYLNTYQEPVLNHTFSSDRWEEVGWAQWGGGFITQALLGVRTTFQIKRYGMWNYGPKNYYTELLEYSSWAILSGYSNAFIDKVNDARDLLHALSGSSADSLAFRHHIIYASTTLVGDGTHFVHNVGATGELAYTPESNLANFTCSGSLAATCGLLNQFFTSSGAMCMTIEHLFSSCQLFTFQGVFWATNCNVFETTVTAPSHGIPCDSTNVYGHSHPYMKSRGNIVYQMLHDMSLNLKIKTGLWCHDVQGCDYDIGGMFTTTNVRRLFFEGYSDPSVLEFLNMKYQINGVHFQCTQNSLDTCGNEVLSCNDAGIMMTLPSGTTKQLTYGITPNEEYFAPYFEMTAAGELLWAFSADPAIVSYAQSVKLQQPTLKMSNPNWAAFPAWNTKDIGFNKHVQCQARMYGGLPGHFTSCYDTLNTGQLNVMDSLQMIKYKGNDTIYHFKQDHAVPMPVNGSTERMQFPMYLWDGFESYPYLYNGTASGPGHFALQAPSLFSKQHALHLELSQRTFIFDWEGNIPLSYPIPTAFGDANASSSLSYGVRRFTESKQTWDYMGVYGTPRDSYGMPYQIPKGMASMELLTNQAIYVGTPHCYGNQAWGGLEFAHVTGYAPRSYSQRSFTDYDSVTGMAMRTAIRQQVQLRVEQNPLMSNIFTSQQRCVSPTKSYSAATGYGCFGYMPLMWFEDGQTQSNELFRREFDHYFRRPVRATVLILIGSVMSTILFFMGLCLYINESHHRAKFQQRVYVD